VAPGSPLEPLLTIRPVKEVHITKYHLTSSNLIWSHLRWSHFI